MPPFSSRDISIKHSLWPGSSGTFRSECDTEEWNWKRPGCEFGSMRGIKEMFGPMTASRNNYHTFHVPCLVSCGCLLPRVKVAAHLGIHGDRCRGRNKLQNVPYPLLSKVLMKDAHGPETQSSLIKCGQENKLLLLLLWRSFRSFSPQRHRDEM